jgi:hypothetical protein
VANSDGTITVDGRQMREVAPMVFRALDAQTRVAFRKDDAGAWEFVDDYPYRVFQRVPWYERYRVNIFTVRFCAAMFGLTVVVWLPTALTRRFRRRTRASSNAHGRRRLLVALVCVVNLIFLWAGYDVFLKLPNPAFSAQAHVLQVLGLIGACGTLLVLDDAARRLSDREHSRLSQLHAIVLSLACVAFVAFAMIWHLFNFSIG